MKKPRGPSLIVVFLALFLIGCGNKPVKIIALTHVNLVPMTGEKVIENQTVLVQGTNIAAVGGSDTLSIPEGAQLIDGHGAYLMPGLAG